MIVEGRIFNREIFNLTDGIIFLNKEDFINASLGFELAAK
jgi:hypothetical protein